MQLLKDLDLEHAALQAKLLEAQAEIKQIDQDELQYWASVNKYEMELLEHQDELASVTLAHEQAASQLESLTKGNVLVDAFQITHDGPFGTINGLRLGRLASQHVEWSEINAAMGQTALLLETVPLAR